MWPNWGMSAERGLVAARTFSDNEGEESQRTNSRSGAIQRSSAMASKSLEPGKTIVDFVDGPLSQTEARI
jgi:hypothetical protein